MLHGVVQFIMDNQVVRVDVHIPCLLLDCYKFAVSIQIFFYVEIFQTAVIDQKFVTRILFHYITFSCEKRFNPVTLQLIEPHLLRKTEHTLDLPRYVAKGRSVLDHGNSIPIARVGWLPRARQRFSNSRCPSISIYMIPTHPAGYL